MTHLVKIINLIYIFFLISSLLFFTWQFFINLITIEIFINVIVFFFASIFLLLVSYRKGKKCFDVVIETIGVNQKIAVPTFMFIFIGGFSIALSIIFIAFLESLGLLFVVESFESLFLNILALICFFWISFILFIGWDFIKISSLVSQYSMIKGDKKSNFLKNIKNFLVKLSSLRGAFLAFVAVDLACRRFKLYRSYYKRLLFPVKVWSACLTIYDNKHFGDSLEEAFSYFKTKSYKTFYISKLAPLFLPLIASPVIFSLGIFLSNFDYFINPFCFAGNCFLIIIYFLIFLSLGFFFSYSIIISLDNAYYVKILKDIKENKAEERVMEVDEKLKIIEEDSFKRISKLKGDIWDIFRVYF